MIPLTELRRILGRLITEVEFTGEPVTVTRNDRPVVRIVPVTPEPYSEEKTAS